MSLSDDPTSPTKKNQARTSQEPRESPQDSSFLQSMETKLPPSDDSTSPTKKNRARTGQELRESPQDFSFLSSKESHETSPSFVSTMNRDEEALKGRHGSFSENPNYFGGSLDSAGNMGSQTYSGYANNGFSEQMMFTSRYANNGQSYLGVEPSNNSVGLRISKPQQMSKSSVIDVDSDTWSTKALQLPYDNLQRLGMEGEGYGTNNLDSFGDQSNFLCVAGSLNSAGSPNSAGSQNDPTLMNVEGKQINIIELPDDILVKILSHLPIKEVVATSVLSKQWRYVWKLALKLELSLGWL